jgi:hypothetical protein
MGGICIGILNENVKQALDDNYFFAKNRKGKNQWIIFVLTMKPDETPIGLLVLLTNDISFDPFFFVPCVGFYLFWCQRKIAYFTCFWLQKCCLFFVAEKWPFRLMFVSETHHLV